jgi:hypothetical protein
MIEAHKLTKRSASGTVVHLAPVLLVAVWGVAWIGLHASEQTGVHTLFQTLALAESVIALLFRRRSRSARSSESSSPISRLSSIRCCCRQC